MSPSTTIPDMVNQATAHTFLLGNFRGRDCSFKSKDFSDICIGKLCFIVVFSSDISSLCCSALCGEASQSRIHPHRMIVSSNKSFWMKARTIAISYSKPSLSCSIQTVFGRCSHPKVAGVATSTVGYVSYRITNVAGVTDKQSLRNRSVSKFVGQSVSLNSLFIPSPFNMSVAAFVSPFPQERPASIRAFTLVDSIPQCFRSVCPTLVTTVKGTKFDVVPYSVRRDSKFFPTELTDKGDFHLVMSSFLAISLIASSITAVLETPSFLVSLVNRSVPSLVNKAWIRLKVSALFVLIILWIIADPCNESRGIQDGHN